MKRVIPDQQTWGSSGVAHTLVHIARVLRAMSETEMAYLTWNETRAFIALTDHAERVARRMAPNPELWSNSNGE